MICFGVSARRLARLAAAALGLSAALRCGELRAQFAGTPAPTAATIAVPSASAASGDTVFAVLRLSRFTPADATDSNANKRAYGFQTSLQVNPAILVFAPGALTKIREPLRPFVLSEAPDGYAQTLNIRNSVPRPLRQGDTLAVIPFIACLGESLKTPFNLGGGKTGRPNFFDWLDSVARPIDLPPEATRLADGAFSLENARWHNLVSAYPGEFTLEIAPNPLPAGSDGVITITLPESWADLTTNRKVWLDIIGLNGAFELRKDFALPPIRGSTSVSVDIFKGELRRGVYVCRYSMGGFSISRLFVVY